MTQVIIFMFWSRSGCYLFFESGSGFYRRSPGPDPDFSNDEFRSRAGSGSGCYPFRFLRVVL